MSIIAIEAQDGVGKDTLIAQIKKNHPDFYFCQFPNERADSGKLARKILSNEINLPDTSLQTTFIVNFYESTLLLKHFKNNPDKTLILNRYFLSTLAYSMAQNINSTYIKTLIQPLPLPDLFILIKGTPRIIGNEKLETNTEFQRKVGVGYDFYTPLYNTKIIQNDSTPEALYQKFLKILKEEFHGI